MGFGSKRGGTKVPNAKLKPVPLAAVSDPAIGSSSNPSNRVNKAKGKQKQTTPIRPDIEEEDDLDRSLFRESLCREKPILAGHVVCFSGILEPVKSQAKAYAEKLGGTVTKALTLDVTHLICDKPGSDKYRAAIENNIKVMLPMWLEALYSSFIEGDTVDVVKITNRYAMKPFHNLKFSITGSSSTTPRTSFIQLAEDHGAAVSMDLDMDCTHLIVLADDLALFDLDKVQAARKAEPLIKAVWQEWLEDSVERGGCLLESPYLVKDGTPRPGRLCLRPPTSAVDGRSEPEQDHSTQDFHIGEPQVTIRRQVTRAGSQTALLASIISAEDLPTRGSSARTESANARVPSPDLDQDQTNLAPPNVQQKVVVASTSAAHDSAGLQISSFLDQSKGGDRLSLVKKLSSVRSSKFEPHVSQRLEDSTSQCDWTAPELFRGYTISIAGCPPNHHRAITQAVTQCGARVVRDHSQADYTIVPHINPLCIPPGCNPVAHSWVELSLFYRKIVDPDRHWAARPIRLQSITNPEQYSFSACGFSIPEVKVIQRVLKAMKMKFIECPRRSEVTHLFIGPEKTSARVQKVQSWSEKGLVNFEWLLSLARGERVGSGKLNTSNDSLRLPSGTLDHQGQSTPLEVPEPLIGCVIYITKKASADRNSRSIGACCKLGARVAEKFEEAVTHLVHVSESSNDTSREFRQAKSKGLHIVHPCWLTECKRKATRADELTFLHTYKPGLALDYETLLTPSRSQAPIDSSGPPDQRASHSSPNAHLDLQEDEEFFDLKQAAVPDDATIGNSFRSQPDRQLNKRPESLPGSSPPANANIGGEFECSTRQSAINAPTSPHTSDNGLTSFASLHRSEPGMETQVGGFISFLQQRMITDDSTKEKEGRRGRKRVLADLSRTSSTGARGHPDSPSTDFHQEADVSKNTGLHRTLSDLTRPSPTRRIPFESNDTEESMRVTWDDTTFGGIVQASSKQNGEGRGDRLRVLVDPTNCFGPARIAPPAFDQHPLGWRPGDTRPVVIDLESDDDRSGNSVGGPASKRRKPRLMS